MKYVSTNEDICIGDVVTIEGNVSGVVVCDFERWECLGGYEEWLTKDEMVGGGHLSSGVLIETKDIGMVHYAFPDDSIIFVNRDKAR